jgi:[NiFe] hydrogenase diaphorase moiety small subunit
MKPWQKLVRLPIEDLTIKDNAMNQIIKIEIDGQVCMGQKGQYLVDVARENGIYIPTLCNIIGMKPRGACRLCTVRVNGKLMTSCTTPISNGMQVETKSEELDNLRNGIIELMFAEGNHFCPACEKSGNCELQALAYRFRISVPRFPFQFPQRDIEAGHPLLIKDHNRCILCKRCIRAIKDESGKSIFAFTKRGPKVGISIDTTLSAKMDKTLAQKAVEICPVGAILPRAQAFRSPIGTRKYDKTPIGEEESSKKDPVAL